MLAHQRLGRAGGTKTYSVSFMLTGAQSCLPLYGEYLGHFPFGSCCRWARSASRPRSSTPGLVDGMKRLADQEPPMVANRAVTQIRPAASWDSRRGEIRAARAGATSWRVPRIQPKPRS